jgi:hypothetical protein
LLLARRSDLTSAGLCLLHDTLRLVAVLHGHLPVAALHFFVGNLELGISRSVVTERENGETRALQPHELYRSQQFATAVYRAELALRLRQLGYEIELGTTGAPEIKGYTSAAGSSCPATC